MSEFTIREAHAADVGQLSKMTLSYVGLDYPWDLLLGGGRRADEPLALVGSDREGVCAMIAVGPPVADVLWERAPGTVDVGDAPWWKVRVLASHPRRRGSAVARALLAETLRRLPRGHIGLYGNVETSRRDAIAWYRRQGFYIGPVSGLTFVERPGRPNSIRIMPTPNEVVFRGYRSVLCDAVDGHPRRDWELKTARAEYRFTVDIYARSSQPARDLGYRLYARRISSNGSSAACVHALMGPRPMFVWGWDPDHARVCYDCSTDHLHAVQKYDTATLCDGCGRHDSDTRVSWATDDEHLLIVASGLCPRCRAGD